MPFVFNGGIDLVAFPLLGGGGDDLRLFRDAQGRPSGFHRGAKVRVSDRFFIVARSSTIY